MGNLAKCPFVMSSFKPKSRCALVIFLLLNTCLSGLSETTNIFFQFVQDQSERQYTQVPHEVLALYYGWYGNPERPGWKEANTNIHQIANTAHYPLKGPYNSHDLAIIDWQIDQAKSHGITGFVVSWWGKGEHEAWHDQSLALLLQAAEKKDFKISVYWEHERDTKAQLIQFAVDDLSYILKHYGKSKAFLKVDGKPVIFVYENVEGQTPLASLVEIKKKSAQKSGVFC
jgi:hypothetical protein